MPSSFWSQSQHCAIKTLCIVINKESLIFKNYFRVNTLLPYCTRCANYNSGSNWARKLIDKMQLTTKNCVNQMKNKGVMAGYGKYAKSSFFGNMAKNNKSMNLSIYISMYTHYVFIPKFMQIYQFVWDIKKKMYIFFYYPYGQHFFPRT